MSQQYSATQTLNEYFQNSHSELSAEDIQIQRICDALAQAQKTISNEKIILKLIKKLETEKDLVSADFYRQALELILKNPNL